MLLLPFTTMFLRNPEGKAPPKRLSVPPETPVDGEIGKMEISGGRFLVAKFNTAPEKIPENGQWIYGNWFPNSGYQPADALPFEVYPEPPKNGKLTVEICVPLKPL